VALSSVRRRTKESIVAPSSPVLLGIDEAGRGSVIGPLVVGGFLVPEADLPKLAELGVRDSKLLTPSRREELFGEIARVGRREHVVLAPITIDRYVRQGRLNELEAQAFGELVRRTSPTRTFVDACDTDAGRFGARVAHWAQVETRCIIARHKADRDLPVVGAASIVAKVHRDRAIARLAKSLGAEIGSGYPSDPVTRDYVRHSLLRPGEAKPWLRLSWATTETLKPKVPPRTLESFPT
jgi:ribonuclease HII